MEKLADAHSHRQTRHPRGLWRGSIRKDLKMDARYKLSGMTKFSVIPAVVGGYPSLSLFILDSRLRGNDRRGADVTEEARSMTAEQAGMTEEGAGRTEEQTGVTEEEMGVTGSGPPLTFYFLLT